VASRQWKILDGRLWRCGPLGGRIDVEALALGTLAAVTILAVFGLTNWDASFNEGFRARVAALELIPPGPFLAIDAAAWRWISGRSVILAPADGPNEAACVAIAYRAQTLVPEPAHFSAYQALYDGDLSGWFGRPAEQAGPSDGTSSDGTEVEVTAVPYFSWDNRGIGPMRVWLPRI